MATKKSNEKVEVEELNIEVIKQEIINYAEKRIEIEAEQAIKRAEKRILKQKNISIIKRNVLILLLLCLSAYLTYTLYGTGYFNKYIKNSNKDKEIQTQITVEQNEKDEPSEQEILLKNYSHLINSIEINENSAYIKDYYNGKLTDELKLYLSLNNIEKQDFIEDGETYILENNILKKSYDELFNDEKYQQKSFKYNDLEFNYLKTQDIFISNKKIEKNNTNIVKAINSIEKKDEQIIILSTEALVEKNKIYNIETKKEINTYKDIESIKDNKEQLNNMKYTFVSKNEKYYLNKIESIK